MNDDPYTPKSMEAARSEAQASGDRFDGLHEEATAAVDEGSTSLRRIRERYREAYDEKLARWQMLREDLERLEGGPTAGPPGGSGPVDAGVSAPTAEVPLAIDDARDRVLRREVDQLVWELADHQAELARLDLAQRTLERTRLFIERGDATLITESDGPATSQHVAMRIVESEEAERSRLAQEIHDGPAQSLSNAIFQVEYIERVLDSDPRLAGAELRHLRVLLRRELGDMRTFISQLRPPLLDEIGLDAAILDAVEHARTVSGATITTSLEGSTDGLNEAARTVVLRVAQEALQNVRKHASATKVTISTTVEGAGFVLEIGDDGRGFDSEAVAADGRRHFGLQFMRERAELIGARLDVRSQPGDGTAVRLTIPTDGATGVEESR
jgi:two-component system, NarL family, sensor histidine kinase DegS